MSKSTKVRSTKAVLKVQGIPALRSIAKACQKSSDNVRTQFCLDMAHSVASNNPAITEKQYRAFKSAIVKVFTTDKAINTPAVDVFGKQDTWRTYANLAAFAAIAMVKYPERTFTALQTSKVASLTSKAAANVGQLLIDADGKKDARGANSKGKASRTPRTPGKAAKVSSPASETHPDDGKASHVTMRRFGTAMVKHCEQLGSMAALLADDNPDPDLLRKVAQALVKTGQSMAAEFDRVKLNASIETGANVKYASLI